MIQSKWKQNLDDLVSPGIKELFFLHAFWIVAQKKNTVMV